MTEGGYAKVPSSFGWPKLWRISIQCHKRNNRRLEAVLLREETILGRGVEGLSVGLIRMGPMTSKDTVGTVSTSHKTKNFHSI